MIDFGQGKPEGFETGNDNIEPLYVNISILKEALKPLGKT